MRAWLNLRYTVPERRAIFTEGLERLGYQVEHGLTRDPKAGDILVTWNRIYDGDTCASIFKERGNKVIVTENASWGNEFQGKRWYTLAKDYHNVSGKFPIDDGSRWDSLRVEPEPWRSDGETVVLPSRGIGPSPYRQPAGWIERQAGRVRRHPGKSEGVPLHIDLRACGRVITWGSGAAIKALLWGIPVESHQPEWIGEQDNTDAGRLAMFRRLACAQATLDELKSGEAFNRLLACTI